MRRRSLHLFLVACGCSIGGFCHLSAADLVLEKVPPLTVEQVPAYPENLARYALGAKIDTVPGNKSIGEVQLTSISGDNNRAISALLCDDPTVGYSLPNGISTCVISLPGIANVESISFLNHNAQGNVSIATSNARVASDSAQWHDAGQHALTPNVVTAKIGPTEAKYVKLDFNVSQPGGIAALGIYPTPAVSDFTMPRSRNVSFDEKSQSLALITSNLSDVHLRARALYVSSGSDVKKANNMIDNQPVTAYTFTGSDTSPAVIVDLGRVCALRRLSAIYSTRESTVDFYVLDSLPVGANPSQAPGGTTTFQDLPQSLRIRETVLTGWKPVGSVASNEGGGHASVDFPVTSGRYVLVRWNLTTQPGIAFSVAEVAAFGGPRDASQIIASNEDRYSGRYPDGKTILDNKEIPAEGPGEGPQAPGEGPPPELPPHPPFTFIPEVVPTSP